MVDIRIKKSSVSGKIPTTSDLAYGELAINYADGRLYYKNSSNVVKNFIDSNLVNITIDSKLAAAGVGDSNQILTLITQNSIDSAGVIALVDSAYVQLRETYSTSSDLLEALKQVDGIGSGLNADLLDSQHGSFYLDYTNFTNTPNVLDSADVIATITADGFTKFDSANASGLISTAINNLIDGAPTALDTLNELAAALNDDANFAATVTNAIAALPDSAQVSAIISADVDKAFIDALNVDADTLDSQHGSFYLDYTNFTNTPNVLDSANVRNIFSASGDLSYNSGTGQFSVTTYKSADFDSDFSGKSTTDLSEGTNLYYTTARADSDAKNAVSAGTGISYNPSTGVISSNDAQIVHDNLSGFVSNEHVDHSSVSITAGAGLTGGGDITTTRTLNIGAGTGITVNADDIEVDMTAFTTSDLSEGTNLYYTTARVDSDIDARVTKTFVDNLNVDADTLDGQDGTYYLDYTNFTNTPNVLDSADVVQIVGDVGIDSAQVTNLVDSDYVQARIPAPVRFTGQVFSADAEPTRLDKWLISDYRSAVYNIQISSPLGYESLELRVLHDDRNPHTKVSLLSSLTGFDLADNNLSVSSQSSLLDINVTMGLLDSPDVLIIGFTPHTTNTYVNYEKLLLPNVGSTYFFDKDLSDSAAEANLDLDVGQNGKVDLSLDLGLTQDLAVSNEAYDLDSSNYQIIDLGL